MIHPHTTPKHVDHSTGLGVFATRDIPKGCVTHVPDELDICINMSTYKTLSSLHQEYLDKYLFANAHGVQSIEWDHTRYMNHCCFANTLCTAYGFDIAIRDIKKDEQITCDYRILCDHKQNFPLSCSQGNCHKILNYTEGNQFIDFWDKRIEEALKEFANVEQPLLKIIDASILDEIQKLLNMEMPYKSVKSRIIKAPI